MPIRKVLLQKDWEPLEEFVNVLGIGDSFHRVGNQVDPESCECFVIPISRSLRCREPQNLAANDAESLVGRVASQHQKS